MLTFRRLLGFLRPYRKGVVWSFALAFGSIGFTVLIPAMTGVAINAIRSGHRHDLVIWAAAIVVAALGRLVFSVLRRLVAGRVSLGVELDLRNSLYGHLQRLELSFFDGQQTGQLMSRATVDLQAVRFFLGYGLIFIAQSVLSIRSRRWRCSCCSRAGRAVAGAGAFRRADRRSLRPPLAAGDPGGPAADRRADRGG